VESRQIIYFDDVSPLNEAVFSFPMVGHLSLRQLGLLISGLVVTFGLYSATREIASIIPLGLAAFMAFRKFNVISTESQLLGVLRFLAPKQEKAQKKTKSKLTIFRESSRKTGDAVEYNPRLDVVGREIPTRDVFWNEGAPVRLQVRLKTPDGRPISKTKTVIKIDDQVIAALATTAGGEIEVVFVPSSLGEKRLAIYAEGLELPVFENILNVRSIS
jgi:hypothetical protein